MGKFIIVAFLFVSMTTKAQPPLTFLSVDSITYQCYQAGDWEKLINVGNEAIKQNIDYKRLRQRIGYAFFVKSDYYAAQLHYEKALAFDEYDADTHAYLYYCGLNTGNEAFARFHAEKLPKDLQQRLKEEAFKPVDAIDLEYNYKALNTISRSNPTYLRAGISTQLGYRLSLYQSVSNYQQTFGTSLTKQPEYFALLSWSVNSHTSLSAAYHYLNSSINGYKYPGNLLFAALITKIDRFSLGLNSSILNANLKNLMQFGLQAGVTLPGKPNIYFNSGVSGMIETGNARIIFSQTAGARLTKSVWAEGNITLGNLLNYHDHNALYIYNSVDPTTFRTGLSLFWYLVKRVTLVGNYTYDTKQMELNNINYNQQSFKNYKQQSFSGGIIWKL
jgi:hypothetical protein